MSVTADVVRVLLDYFLSGAINANAEGITPLGATINAYGIQWSLRIVPVPYPHSSDHRCPNVPSSLI